MKSTGSGQIQFINLSHPEDGTSTSGEQRRRANSHAARTAHARARRRCMIEYQASKTSQGPENAQAGLETPRSARKSSERPVSNIIETEEPLLPSPISLLASDRRDPFQSFARPFQPIEYFLLDHCESLHHLHDYYQSKP